MAELKANNQKPNFDNNPKLIEAIAEMRKNFCAETQNKVILRTRARLSSFFSTTTKQTAHFSLFSLPLRRLKSSSMTSHSRALQ